MADGGFDIRSLLAFEPPLYRCQACLALLTELDLYALDRKAPEARCPVCNTLYVFEAAGRLSWYLKSRGLAAKHDNLIEHAKELAHTAWGFHDIPETYPPLKALMEALSHAKNFVHFTSYGMSHFFVGALKMVAQRIPVSGIVSNVDEGLADELTGHTAEADWFEVRTFVKGPDKKAPPEGWEEVPHQKLVIIDGLVAFEGSANLTVSAWRKAAIAREQVKMETNVSKVIELNNRYFSPIWYELNSKPSQVLVR